MDASALLKETGPLLDSGRLADLRGSNTFTPQILRAPARVRLATVAREAAATCPVRPRVEEFFYEGEGPILSRELLGLLTFSYGTKLYTFERIYDSSRGGVLSRSLIDPLPHPSTLRAFRRLERPAVVSALETFFESVATLLAHETEEEEHAAEWLETVGLDCRPSKFDKDSLNKIVTERVNQATWIDRMMMDY